RIVSRCSSLTICRRSALLQLHVTLRHPHPFPTRRSSDLSDGRSERAATVRITTCSDAPAGLISWWRGDLDANDNNRRHHATLERSEEHTSELQSHLNIVCRLLLEKKKKQITQNIHKENTS